MQITKLLPALLLFSFVGPAQASATLDSLWSQGKWAAVGTQAADEKDYLTAVMAMQRLQECPMPSQPKGQVWDAKIAAQGVTYARAALNSSLNKADKVHAYMNLGNMLGHQANALTQTGTIMTAVRDGLGLARQSKASYESALAIDSDDGLLTATYAFWHSKGYQRVGVIIGASQGEARHWIFVAQQAFNTMPEANKSQLSDKAWTAVRIAEALESLRDKKMLPYFEAAIKLGEQLNDADGRCAANVARVHLGRDVTTF